MMPCAEFSFTNWILVYVFDLTCTHMFYRVCGTENGLFHVLLSLLLVEYHTFIQAPPDAHSVQSRPFMSGASDCVRGPRASSEL